MNLLEPGSPPQAIEPLPQLLRLPAVLQATGLARSTVYRMVAEHTFPAPVKLAKRAVGWRHDDVRQWTIGRPSTSR
jgi:prophage regulatory protein